MPKASHTGIAQPRTQRKKKKKKNVTAEGGDPTEGDGRRWATGSKFQFLHCRIELWRIAEDLDNPSEFYDKVTLLFIKKYGWDLPIAEDSPEPLEEPSEDGLQDLLKDAGLSAEEKDRRQTIYYDVRDVRVCSAVR